MTHPFRSTPTPKHQIDRKECENYSSYLKTLKRDFNKRCGYCNDLDSHKIRSFTIDHFVPQNPKDFTHNIKPNNYFNLIYSCNYCNSAKSNKFPTKNPNIHNDGKIGFIKPTEDLYNNLFWRDGSGSIYPSEGNMLASHIVNELNLRNPIHSLMWRFERILALEEAVRVKLETNNDNDLIKLHYNLMSEVIEIVKYIFSTND